MELEQLRGVCPARLKALRAMGICSLRDLLFHLPARYEDMSALTPAAEARPGMTVVLEGELEADPKIAWHNGLARVTAALRDATGRMPLIWFNQPWLMKQLHQGETLTVYGRVGDKTGRRVMQTPKIVDGKAIRPVYHGVKGIPAKNFEAMMKQALEQLEDCCPETLPNGLRLRHGLCELNFALREAHFPQSMTDLQTARRRLAFEQMLLYLAAVASNADHAEPGFPMDIPADAADRFWASLPFRPTGAQRRVLDEIAADLRRDVGMSRLVQGDVGCGKTAIAFGAIRLACEAGFQCAMMAPTDILARQHYESARAMLEPLGVQCGLLTGSLRAAERREALQNLASGTWQAVFGTHALISEGVRYRRLGLVITDEQHRVGVNQRTTLQEKGAAEERKPHVLVMSATPIPRTLALILYGDLALSVVDELPPGRTPVRTRIVPESKREDMYGFVRREAAAGRQAYVVCPLVEESEELGEVRSAQETWQELTNGPLQGLRVGLTWGAQPPQEKAETLAAFSRGETDVLVSTTVIEVGVNVPNASVMVIENAERYGLSQLHQLRGRVGRGTAESWCFLLAEPNERLRVLTETNDGFIVAQKDLELRGPGDLMGTRQAGEAIGGFLPDGDVRLLDEAARCVRELHENNAFRSELEQVEAEAARVFAGRIARN